MTDQLTTRQLLELAAKAAGRTLQWSDDGSMCWLDRPLGEQLNNDEPWRPREDDGDSKRLAVALKITVEVHDDYLVACRDELSCSSGFSDYNSYADTAWRWSVLSVAAQIGAAMP